MSNSASIPSTIWRLKPVIYGAAQNHIASETSTQPRITNTSRKQLKKIGFDALCPCRDQGNREEEITKFVDIKIIKNIKIIKVIKTKSNFQ